MKLVLGVMDIGEALKSKTIMDRIIDRYGPSHTAIPKNTYALSSVLMTSEKISQIGLLGETKRYLWRRDE